MNWFTLPGVERLGDILDLREIDLAQVYAAYLAVMHCFPIKLSSLKV